MSMNELAAVLSSAWAAIGVPLANHLWQSTLFAAAAGVLVLLLKKNQAQAHYWIWFAASMKFLVPFSILISLGSRLASPVASGVRGYDFLEVISQPFSPVHPAQQAASAALALLLRFLPALLLAGWFCGFAAVLFFWQLRWARMRAILRKATPIDSGRELEMLHRLEKTAGNSTKVRLMLSEAALEPGIVGIFHPIMLLPSGIAERLSDAQLQAILTHELCHVRRRDNLAAVLHMLVEALFWFHPLIWWLGSRLVAERERACDEDVLHRGSEPQAYAEGILKVCEFYLESPLVCVAGVTGSNLKQRIEEIMVHRIARKLNLAKKLLLAAVGTAALVLPVVFGLLHPLAGHAQSQQPAASPVFSDVSIKPVGAISPGEPVRMRFLNQNGTLDIKNVTLEHLIQYAYGVNQSQIAGAPSWIASDLFDMNVKTNEDVHSDRFKLAVQDFLSQRFKLAVHRELKNAQVFELTVGPNGPKLAQSASKELDRMLIQPVGHLEATSATMGDLVKFLQNFTGSVVTDKTGLTGLYDFTLNAQRLTIGSTKSPDDIAALQKAVSEQLGLELNPQSGLINTLVIDHAEKLSGENGSN